MIRIAVHHHLTRQGHGTTVTTQQQTASLQHGQILADGHFRGGEVLGQGIDADFALFLHQGHYGVTALLCVAFGHLKVSIRKNGEILIPFLEKSNGK